MTTNLPKRIVKAFEDNEINAFETLEEYVEPIELKGNLKNAIHAFESGIFVGKEIFGKEDSRVQKACEEFILKCNKLSMELIQQGSFPLALEFLNLAEQHTSSTGYIQDISLRKRLRAITFNNYGCFYKRSNKLHTAIQYLEKALKLESSTTGCDNPAGTHLNICAILSQLKRHDAAADHAKCAIQLLKYERTALFVKEREEEVKHQDDQDEHLEDTNYSARMPNSILSIAYYNWGAELEHLRRFDQALHAYEESQKFALLDLPDSSPMHVAIRKAIKLVKKNKEAIHSQRTPRSSNSRSSRLTPRAQSPQSIRLASVQG